MSSEHSEGIYKRKTAIDLNTQMREQSKTAGEAKQESDDRAMSNGKKNKESRYTSKA
jgi:hypothetical protein